MPFLNIPKPWQLPEHVATAEAAFLNRRKFLKGLIVQVY
jgi:methionine sulfoxide reductase catalytic subunit